MSDELSSFEAACARVRTYCNEQFYQVDLASLSSDLRIILTTLGADRIVGINPTQKESAT